MKERVCAVCGTSIAHRGYNVRFCSRECRLVGKRPRVYSDQARKNFSEGQRRRFSDPTARAQSVVLSARNWTNPEYRARHRVDVVCQVCGAHFVGGSHRARYCPACQDAKEEIAKARERERVYRAGQVKVPRAIRKANAVCAVCGKRIPPEINPYGQKKYCQLACDHKARDARNRRRAKEKRLEKRKNRPWRLCSQCGVPFQPRYSRIRACESRQCIAGEAKHRRLLRDTILEWRELPPAVRAALELQSEAKKALWRYYRFGKSEPERYSEPSV